MMFCGVYGSGVWPCLDMLSIRCFRFVGCRLLVFLVGLMCSSMVLGFSFCGSGSCMMNLVYVGLVLSLLIVCLMLFWLVLVGRLCWIDVIFILV